MTEYRADFLEDKQEVYADAVAVSLSLNRSEEAMAFAERAKSRALIDLLAHRIDLQVQAKTASEQPIVDDLMRLKAARDRAYRRLESGDERSGDIWTLSEPDRKEARQNLLTLERKVTDRWHRLLIRNADYARDADLSHVHVEPIQPYLPPDTLLIEFFAVHDELVAFLVTAESVESRRLGTDLGEIVSIAQLFALNLSAVPQSAPAQIEGLTAHAQGLLQRLFEGLIQPLNATLTRYVNVIIVPTWSTALSALSRIFRW